MLGPDEIQKRFGTTSTSPDGTVSSHDALRSLFENLANTIDGAMEDSREKSLALTELEAASMWAHKALANSFRAEIPTRVVETIDIPNLGRRRTEW